MDGMLSAEEIDALLRMPIGSGPEEGEDIDALLDLTSEMGEVEMPSKEEIDALMDELTGGGEMKNTGATYNPEGQTGGVVRSFADQIKAMYNCGYRDGKKDGKADAENDIARNTDASDYQRGLDDAWELARKILYKECDGYSLGELEEIFNKPYRDTLRRTLIIVDFGVSEVLAKIREWEEKKEEENLPLDERLEMMCDGEIQWDDAKAKNLMREAAEMIAHWR